MPTEAGSDAHRSCSEAVSDGVGLRALLKPQGSCCSSSTEPSDWFRPRMSVLTASLAKSGWRQWWSLSLLFFATLVTSGSPNGDSSPTQNQCLWFRSRTKVCQSPLNTELPQQCVPSHKSMVTVVVGLVTTLTGSKGRIKPSCCSECHSLLKNVNSVSQDHIQSNEWPSTQQSLSAGAMAITRVTLGTDVPYCRCYTSPVRCALLQVTSDPWHRCDVLTLPVLCDHLLMECKSVLQGRCSGRPSDLEAVLPWVTQAPVLS